MRAPFAFRRFLVAASTLLVFASSLALLVPDDASGAETEFAPWYRFMYFSDASYTTQVGQIDINAGCKGEDFSWGTQTPYVKRFLINYCY